MKLHTLVQPIITEKSMADASSGVFTFEVSKSAGKNEIKSAIEQSFGVTVLKVTTIVRKGASTRTGRRRLPSTTVDRKIARAWVKDGQKIDLFDFKEK